MPLFNHQKKQSVPAPEEPKKSIRQLMAEQESGCKIRHITDPTPMDGEIYEAEYWAIVPNIWTLPCAKIPHPGLCHLKLSTHYASLDSALCALEKALYGFDLSGRDAAEKADPKPAPEEPKAACAPDAYPTVTLEIVSPEKIEVSCHGVFFDGGDPTGTYLSIEGAVAALDEAVADPYEREEKKGAKRKAS